MFHSLRTDVLAKDLLNDQVEGTAGVHAGGLGMMGSEGEQYLMGEEATDIVIGALKQVHLRRKRG